MTVSDIQQLTFIIQLDWMSTSRITPSPLNFILNSLHSEIGCVFFCHFHDLQGFCDGSRLKNPAQLSRVLFLLSNGWQARCGCLRTSGTAVLGNKERPIRNRTWKLCPTGNVNYTYISYVLMLCWYYYDEWTTLHGDLGFYLLFLHISHYQCISISTSPEVPHLTILTHKHTHNKKHQHMWKSSNTTTVQH